MKKEKRTHRYFIGVDLFVLMSEITRLLIQDLLFDENPPNVKIIPVNSDSDICWWEFYSDDVKICAVFSEMDKEMDRQSILCWLEWYNDLRGESLRELYEREELMDDMLDLNEDECALFEAA